MSLVICPWGLFVVTTSVVLRIVRSNDFSRSLQFVVTTSVVLFSS
ncbi:MAG: hypothetical protein ACRC8Y_24605 [Chroococcales cyanobacterium]